MSSSLLILVCSHGIFNILYALESTRIAHILGPSTSILIVARSLSSRPLPPIFKPLCSVLWMASRKTNEPSKGGSPLAPIGAERPKQATSTARPDIPSVTILRRTKDLLDGSLPAVTKDPDLDQALESHVQTIEHLVTDSTTDFDGESDGSNTRPGTNTPGSFKLTYRGQEFVPQKSASEHVEQGKKCNRRKERPPPPFTEAQRARRGTSKKEKEQESDEWRNQSDAT